MAAVQREATRVVTGKSTIPVFDTLSGTLTTNGTVDTVLDYTGALTALEVFGPDFQKAQAQNLYVYESTSTDGSVRQIKSVFSNVDGTSWSIKLYDAFATPLSAENLKIVTADLQDYSVTNTGASSGVYDGVAYATGVIVNRSENTNIRQSTVNRVAKAINATSTSFFIIENR